MQFYLAQTQNDLCRVGKALASKGMVHYLLGTISARLNPNPPMYLVKPADCLYELAEPSDFVLVNSMGEPLDGTNRRPSLNFLAHLACYNARPDINSVVHAHPEKIVALISQTHYIFNPSKVELLTQEAVWMVKNGAIPVVEDLDPEKLAEAVGQEILKSNVVAIRNHGIIAVGKDINEAYGTALVAESEAAIISSSIAMGGIPLFRDEKTAAEDLQLMPPTFSPKFMQHKPA